MLTHEEFLELELKMGVSPFNISFIGLCNNTVDAISKEIEFSSVLDYGAGVGAYSNSYHFAGYNVLSYELFKPHRDYISNHMPFLSIVDEPITTDLMNFIEVAEHMTDKEIVTLFNKIQPKHILFSSTPNYNVEGTAKYDYMDRDSEWGHINIKSHEGWNEMFDKLGYDFVKSMEVPTTWSKLYKRKVKDEQKNIIIEIMKGDEELGLYDL